MKRNKIHYIVMLAVFAGLFLTVSAQAATYTVDRTDDATVSTCTAEANDCTLRGAIAAANATAANDTIDFDATIFNAAQTITLSGTQLQINNNGTLTINGTGVNLLTVSGNNVSRVFLINFGATATINGITITQGNGVTTFNGFGGAILNFGTLTITNSTVSSSSSTNNGGGIYMEGGTTIVTNSTFNNNSSTNNGGGIFVVSSTLTVTNSTFNNNSSTFGGGIGRLSGTVTITNSTISGNSATGGGGGIGFSSPGQLTLTNSTISGNSANSGGGLSIGNSATTTLDNTIIANSTSGGDCVRNSGTVNASYSLIEDNLTCVNGTSSNNLTGDPNLDTLQNNGGATETHALIPGSIAIDTGNSTLTTDQRGFPRPVDVPSAPNGTGNFSDIGAFELQSAPTAAGVSIGGRVLTSDGMRGVANAIVYFTDQNGNVRTERTNSSGYYHFDDIEVGQTVVLSVISKRYLFSPKVVSLANSITDLDFTAQNQGKGRR